MSDLESTLPPLQHDADQCGKREMVQELNISGIQKYQSLTRKKQWFVNHCLRGDADICSGTVVAAHHEFRSQALKHSSNSKLESSRAGVFSEVILARRLLLFCF